MKHLKRIRNLFFVFSFFGLLLLVGAFCYAKFSPKLEIKSANNLVLYDSSKTVFFQGSDNKEWVSLSDISENVIHATISTEDKNFYNHKGFDIFRILKALYINIVNRSTKQGASTISQQYAKNLFLDFDKTWKRKWDEALYTLRLEANYSKNEILEGYLNTINYGHGMYGIENASKYYFNKPAKELDLAEASILVGVPKSPSNYSPLVNLDIAKKRQKIILDLMVKNNYISQAEADRAYNKKLEFYGKKEEGDSSTIMYYHDAVLDELNQITSIPKNYSETKGLKIYTNLDVAAQMELEKNINEQLAEEEELQVAAVMMNPNTGGIVALIGGRDYNQSQYNRATTARRQVGSTMKPYLYYAALESGFTTSSSFTSEKTTFTFSERDDYSPKNYNDKYGNKAISMAAAVSYSDNIYAVKTNLFLGSDSLINVAKRVGITTNFDDVPSLPLGTNEIKMTEMTAGYASFANLGYKVTPHLIERVEDSEGHILYEAENKKTLVLNSSIVFILNNMLTATYDPLYIDYNYPTAIGLASKLKHTYALKSGTTNTDEWYIGYNNDIVTSVWLGNDDNKEIPTNVALYAQNIWYKSIENYEDGKENKWYDKPDNVSAVLVDPISGQIVDETANKKKLMYFIKGTEPSTSQAVFDEKLNEVGIE
ncbi:MAG: PBP1A family penicillin-binding protein [Bacilli bacterium]|nr:PBP1A family penicillin-binding protein [Bacilli bacterium]